MHDFELNYCSELIFKQNYQKQFLKIEHVNTSYFGNCLKFKWQYAHRHMWCLSIACELPQGKAIKSIVDITESLGKLKKSVK